jgi:hypothetical protein
MDGAIGEMGALRRRGGDATGSSRRRSLYFCLAALWGYVLGIAVLAAALSRGDEAVALDGGTALWLVGGTLFGLAGGWTAAGAYRESRRRHR